MNDLLDFLEQTARAAGEVHLRYFRRLEGYDRKGDIDLQTVADRESEALIAERIRARFPNDRLLLEESGAHGIRDAETVWVVDPLDGTTNYAHGIRIFAVSIGVIRRGQPVAGAIFAPALDELYLCARGGGAWRNRTERLRVGTARTLNEALLVTGFPYNRGEILDPLMRMMRAALARSQGVLRLGAASLDLAAVASGQLDGFYEYHLKPWDMGAGALLVEEAGGRVSDLSGNPHDVFEGTVVATNGLIHDALLEHVTRPVAPSLPPLPNNW